MQEFLAQLSRVLDRMGTALLDLGPRILTSIMLLAVGVGAALLLRVVTRKLFENLDRIVPSKRLRASLRSVAAGRSAAGLLSTVVFWFVLLLFLAAATETIGLPILTTWLSGAARYVPRILSAMVIVFAGLAGGVFVRDLGVSAAARMGIGNTAGLGRILQTAVVLLAVLIAVDQLGVDTTTLTALIVTLLGVGLLGGALAFGIGARTEVSNILACHYVRKAYRVGHRVRVGEVEGEIVQIGQTNVTLDSDDGHVVIPARMFSETISTLLVERG